jgi:hypothetical protein
MSALPHIDGRASALPLADALAIIPSLPRPLLSRLVARAIERLDEMDGDADLEDATNAEDEGLTWAAISRDYGPGCHVADAAEDNCDREDVPPIFSPRLVFDL